MSLSSKRVRLTKINGVENPRFHTPERKDHTAGEENPGQSLPVDYWVEGEICQSAIKTLLPVLIKRDTRNGIKMPGYLKTSPVMSVEEVPYGFIFSTENSVYKLEVLENTNES